MPDSIESDGGEDVEQGSVRYYLQPWLFLWVCQVGTWTGFERLSGREPQLSRRGRLQLVFLRACISSIFILIGASRHQRPLAPPRPFEPLSLSFSLLASRPRLFALFAFSATHLPHPLRTHTSRLHSHSLAIASESLFKPYSNTFPIPLLPIR